VISVLAAIIHKELLDGLRDRRAVASAFSFPMFAPLLIAFMLNSLATSNETPLDIAIIGAEQAPGLVDFIDGQGIDLSDPPADTEAAQAAIADGDLHVVLVIPSDYGEKFRSGRPARVEMLIDDSQDAARAGIATARQLLQAYGGHIGTLRLMARGVDPGLVSPIMLDEQSLSNPQKRAANLLDMIIMFVVLGAFVCSMYIAIEAAAGERERKSLEPLLINPTPRWLLVTGKWLASVAFGVAGILFTLICLVVVFQQLELETLGFRIILDVSTALQIFLIALPLAPFAGAAQLLIASFTRSFKEAQLYISLSLTLPMLPGMIMSINPIKTESWMLAVPLLGQQLMGTQLLRGEGIEPLSYLLASAGTLAISVFFLYLTVRLFEGERILFGKA
jgi:sodium transport system permease protein